MLIGYRGTGKSTVSKILSERLGMEVVSTDELIIERAGKRIPEIVESSGWDYFRDLESEVVREVASRKNLIIDAGGGVIIRPQNVEHLRRTGTIFWLTAAVSVIAERIQGDTERPSLTGKKSFTQEISEVLQEREPLYRAAARHIVNTDRRSPQEIAEHIIKKLKAKSI